MNQQQNLINFGAGPATLPTEVLTQASKAILNYQNSGLSILELPHRGSALFDELLQESKSIVLSLAKLDPNEYEVLWLQGGGRTQFAMVPMNFLAKNAIAGYIDSGHWANDAIENAQLFGQVKILASTKAIQYTEVPELGDNIPQDLSYIHLTTNNTIYGTQLHKDYSCSVPIIADMSSDIFSCHRDYSRYDLIYAVAQKNLGIAGVTMVLIKKNLLEKTVRTLAPIFDYRQHVAQNSVLNTAPVFAIYVSLLYLRWMQQKGLKNIIAENDEKAKSLYSEIERNSLLQGIVAPAHRSKMNVVFKAQNKETEKKLIDFCLQLGITGIAGHRSVGGLRVSLYNAISIKQTHQLINALQQFEKLQ